MNLRRLRCSSILAGELEPDEGTYKWGVTTSQSYFPKDNTKEFDNDDTIVDWLTQYLRDQGCDLCPRIPGTYAVRRRGRCKESPRSVRW